MNINLITGNKNKIAEARYYLGEALKFQDIELDEIQELDANKVIEHKVRQAYKIVGEPVFVWDTSVYIDALNGFPGPLIKWFHTQVGVDKICQIVSELGQDKARVEIIIGFFDGHKIEFFTASQTGTIAPKPAGDMGWGWDKMFIPEGSNKTFAQMDDDERMGYRLTESVLMQLKDYLS